MRKKRLCKILAAIMALTTVMTAASPAMAATTGENVEGIVGPVYQEDCTPDENGKYKVLLDVCFDDAPNAVQSGIVLPEPKISAQRALPGETVTIDTGDTDTLVCSEISVYVEPQGGGVYEYKTTEKSFEMPAAKVCVTVNYAYRETDTYSITLDVIDSIYDIPIPTLSCTTAHAGDTVVLDPDERNYCNYDGMEVTTLSDSHTFKVDDTTFIMPASDIIVKPLYVSIGIPEIMEGSYKDMTNPKSAYYKAVYWSANSGVLLHGTRGRNFGINDKCARGSTVFALWNMSHRLRPDLNGKLNFPDVPSDHEYYRAILWAYQKGIAKGYSDGTFGINKNVTRGEFIMMLWRYMGSPQPKAVSKAPFKDVSKTNAFYKSTLWAYQKGIAKGYSDGTFGVNRAATRGDLALFMYRTLPE